MPVEVARLGQIGLIGVRELFKPYSLTVETLGCDAVIPGSYWGETEAGLIGNVLYARSDTPVHSVLHEAAHFVCMDATRRESLHQDAGGDYAEEDAVCYLQILWADLLEGFDRQRMWRDMDAWGYTFRLGSAQRWFEEDAADARAWLERVGIIEANGCLTGQRRE